MNYDSFGNVTGSSPSTRYTYDTRDRLTAASHPNQTNESYTLDDVGNRTASHQGASYSYQAFNRLTAANGSSFSYDANGNLISKTDASGNWTYTWDYENRLTQAALSGGPTVTYTSDALGRRTQRASTNTGTTKFVYDGPDILRDLDGGDNVIADYLNGFGIDNKLRQISGSTSEYFVHDHLGSTWGLADVTGVVTSNQRYDSFGNVPSGALATRYTFTGREVDAESGLMYYRARLYNPHEGRFLSEDPIGLRGGINLFAYVHNAPINNKDPMGLDDADKPWYVEDKGPLYPTSDQSPFNDGGVFSSATLIEFFSALERSKQPCNRFGERFTQSFIETNQFLPGALAPTGTGVPIIIQPGTGLRPSDATALRLNHPLNRVNPRVVEETTLGSGIQPLCGKASQARSECMLQLKVTHAFVP